MYFRTGPAKCEERCIVMSDNPDLEPENNAIVVTESGTEVVVRPVALGSCQVTIMVVGGGGAIPDNEVQPSHCGHIHTQPNRSCPINVLADFFMRHQD
jgi:hypothetical protein